MEENDWLYFMADVPHLLKNLRAGLCNGNDIMLPPDIVKRENLPGCRVTVEHLEALHNFQKPLTFKLASQLREKDFNPAHFDKMDVGSALRVFHHATASALRELVARYKFSNQLLVTAWFVEKTYEWFRLMTSRHRKWALSHAKMSRYNEAIASITDFKDLIERIAVGKQTVIKKGKKAGQKEYKWAWKPWQTGIALSSAAMLEIQHFYLTDGLPFLLTSRFTQVC